MTKYLNFATLSNVKYFIVNCATVLVWKYFSVPLSYILFFLDLSVVLTFQQCVLFQYKNILFLFHFFQLIQCHLHMLIYSIVHYRTIYHYELFLYLLSLFVKLSWIILLIESHHVSILCYFKKKRMTAFLLF